MSLMNSLFKLKKMLLLIASGFKQASPFKKIKAVKQIGFRTKMNVHGR